MTKTKILLVIPLAIIGSFLTYTWATILFTEINSNWRHYVALVFFVLLLFLYFKSFTKTILATGFYLILGTCNLLTLTPSVVTNAYGVRIISVELWTPTFQLVSFILLILFFIMNFDSLVDIYLDYKEARKTGKK